MNNELDDVVAALEKDIFDGQAVAKSEWSSVPIGHPDYFAGEAEDGMPAAFMPSWRRVTVKKSVKPIPSNQDRATGEVWEPIEKPFDYVELHKLADKNDTHAAAIQAKAASLVGLGFRHDDVLDILDPLTNEGFMAALIPTSVDFVTTGCGALEVIRDLSAEPQYDDAGNVKPRPIIGITSIPMVDLTIVREDRNGANWHFEYEPISSEETGTSSIGPKRFARFGDREGLIRRATRDEGSTLFGIDDPSEVSEIIFFADRVPTKSPWYGWPTYMAALQFIDKASMICQHESDFFHNRCVPEFLMFLLGRKLDAATWEQIKTVMGQGKGLGNQFRSGAFNLPGDTQVQVEKLGLETSGDGTMMDAHNQSTLERILSAHMIPSILAGITSGKKNPGATNEFTNALQTFQLLYIALKQRYFSQVLACTLGEPLLNGGLKLGREHFMPKGEKDELTGKVKPGTQRNGFRTLLDEIDLGQSETLARMKQTLPEANAQGRDLSKGLKEKGGDTRVQA